MNEIDMSENELFNEIENDIKVEISSDVDVEKEKINLHYKTKIMNLYLCNQ